MEGFNAARTGESRENPAGLLLAATFSRLLINTGRRFVYPFAPALSRGLGVPLEGVTALVAANQVTGLFSPIFGTLSDRWGYRRILLAALAVLGLGMGIGGLFPFYLPVMAALFLAGIAKNLFDPAVLAFAGEKVPYSRRGMAIGLMETAWAGSSLLGIPLIGLLIARLGWRSPFFALAALAGIAFVILFWLVPANGELASQRSRGLRFSQAWGLVRAEPLAMSALGFAFCVSAANDSFFVVFGVWLEGDFGLSLTGLGLSAGVIGAAELCGEGLTAALADRMGLKSAVVAGLLASGIGYLLIPLANAGLFWALAGLFGVFLTVEFTIVSSLSFFTEVLPRARATMMASYLAAAGLGRMSGALMGGFVWRMGGIVAIALVSAGITALGLLALGWGIHRSRS